MKQFKIPKSNKQKKAQLQAKKEEARKAAEAEAERRKQKPKVYILAQKVRNLPAAIEAAFNGEKFESCESSIRHIVDVIKVAPNRDFFKQILLHFANLRIDISGAAPDAYGRRSAGAVDALKHLSLYAQYAVRPVEDWKPNTHNINRQVASFARHLYGKYHVPAFFDSVWFTNVNLHHRWFIHVAQGANIRTAETLPIPLTKKEAHFVMQAPKDFNVQQAFRYGQVLNMGGNEHFVRQILRTRIAVDFNNNDFWMSLFRWFQQNPMLDAHHYGPIVDFIYNQKYVPSIVDEEGRMVAPQPNMTMKGRDPESLLRQVENWHPQIGRERRHNNHPANFTNWNPCGISGLYHENKETKTIHRISEICTQADLVAEGRTMRHCVGSYSYSCATGRVSIWKFEEITRGGTEKRLTIEVSNKERTIIQARGKYNAIATESDKHWLREWARKAGLGMSRYMI